MAGRSINLIIGAIIIIMGIAGVIYGGMTTYHELGDQKGV